MAAAQREKPSPPPPPPPPPATPTDLSSGNTACCERRAPTHAGLGVLGFFLVYRLVAARGEKCVAVASSRPPSILGSRLAPPWARRQGLEPIFAHVQPLVLFRAEGQSANQDRLRHEAEGQPIDLASFEELPARRDMS